MSFHTTSEDIRLEGHILKARARNGNGDLVDSEINLNDFIGNDDGKSSLPPVFDPQGFLVEDSLLVVPR